MPQAWMPPSAKLIWKPPSATLVDDSFEGPINQVDQISNEKPPEDNRSLIRMAAEKVLGPSLVGKVQAINQKYIAQPLWDNIIQPRIGQLKGETEGILNPAPEHNPMMMGSFLPKLGVGGGFHYNTGDENKFKQPPTEEDYKREDPRAKLGRVVYNNAIRPMLNPMGALGAKLGSSIPEEPIGMGAFSELPEQEASVLHIPDKTATDNSRSFLELQKMRGERGAFSGGKTAANPGSDVGLGFNRETGATMPYPYNVVPNQFRPRQAQTVLDSLTPNRYKNLPFEPPPTVGQGGIPATIQEVINAKSQEFADKLKAAPVPLTKFQSFANIVGAPKSIQASLDLSAPLRQGLPLITTKQYYSSLKPMMQGFGSGEIFEASQNAIEGRAGFDYGRKMGLKLTDVGQGMQKAEESFISNAADKIPILGRLKVASERAYVAFLNNLRAGRFDYLVDKYKNLHDGEIPDSVGRQLAKFVNVSTGRGDLGRFEKNAPELNALFFSPRLIASRLTMLNPKYYVDADPFVRRQAVKALLSVAGVGLAVDGMGYAAGGIVNHDLSTMKLPYTDIETPPMFPTNTDFGKVTKGNTRLDPWGGFQQYVIEASRLVSGKDESSVSGREWDLNNPGFNTPTRKTVIENALRYKLSPAAKFAWSFLAGKDELGNPFDFTSELGKAFVPLFVQDLKDLYKEDPTLLPRGWKATFGVAGLLGMGVNTYQPKVQGFTMSPMQQGALK